MPTQPNILLIMCDQLRHDWLGYRGLDFGHTPNIDKLAAKSRVFTQTTCNSPVCAPSRIGFAAGMRPHKLGALNNHAYLPLSQRTYYQQLRDQGYHVGCVGKLDLAKPAGDNGMRGDRPWTYAWGFTMPHECEGKMHAGRGEPPNGPYTHWLRERDPDAHARFCADYRNRAGGGAGKVLEPSVVPAELFEDVYIGQKSCQMIDDFPGDFPWHLFVSFVGPHNPFDPPAEWFARYEGTAMPAAVPHLPDGKPPRYARTYRDLPTEAEIERARRLYTAYIACIDEQIGHILQTLEDTGQTDNTYIAFTADHGEMLGDHGRWTKGVHQEASLRVPLMVAGPGITPGASDAIVELNDLNATFCDFADAPQVPNADARSLVSLLRNETDTHRDYAMATIDKSGCVRTPEWKLILPVGGVGKIDETELYDLVNDPDERVNVAADHPDRVAALRQHYVAEWVGVPHR